MGGGGLEILLVASCYGNWDKFRPDEPLGLPYLPSLDIVGNLMHGKIQNTHVTECDSTGKIIPNLM